VNGPEGAEAVKDVKEEPQASPLQRLIEYGQSYWLDNLTRRLIVSGELEEMVGQGLRGVTSNPAIFEKAMSSGEDYDAQLRELAVTDCSVPEIYERLVTRDIQQACDILRPVYDASEGEDGFVSLEVSPHLAYDGERTMAEARRLWLAVDRPNLLIKVPGTAHCVSAVQELLFEGININITLLFSESQYQAVAEAYLQALERRLKAGRPLRTVNSVASFFVSRIDLLVDQLLSHRMRPEETNLEGVRPEELIGSIAIANAKQAYQGFKQIASSDRWKHLSSRGARVQRLLWASTSTKDPLYSDVRYIEPLIGPKTVNTMPLETARAFARQGLPSENAVEKDLVDACCAMASLLGVDVDFDQVSEQLQSEGVQKFIEPFDKLMAGLANKRSLFLKEELNGQTFLSGHEKTEAAAQSLDRRQLTRRLFARDGTLWTLASDQRKAIRNRLGWLFSPAEFRNRLEELELLAEEIKQAGFSQVALLGMGGSSLCPEVCAQSFGSRRGWPKLLVLDNTDPDAVRALESQLDLKKTLFIVSSKSGTTTETACFAQYFFEELRRLRGDSAGEAFLAITDPGSSLEKEARERGFRHCLLNPPDIGGRYSVFSYFGLAPMALIGMDVSRMIEEGEKIRLSCGPGVPAVASPGAQLGVFLGLQARQGRDKLTFVLSDSISAFGHWVEQLLAESTGKQGLGIVPVVEETLAPPEAYAQDRVFVQIRVRGEKDKRQAMLSRLAESGHPVATIELRDVYGLGGEFFRWEYATAVAGVVLQVNPFDEPNVAESKQNTRALLAQWKKDGSFPEGEGFAESRIKFFFPGMGREAAEATPATGTGFTLFRNFLSRVAPPDYVALLPYFLKTPERDRALQSLRMELRDRFKAATNIGYGPRYLHSTGQLHKGGPNNGVFIMLTSDSEDLPIPGEEFGFATLQRAQALGDLRALVDKSRRVVRVHLSAPIEKAIKELERHLSD
jgi:transaldolase / glucose-6-phosphate isomerase